MAVTTPVLGGINLPQVEAKSGFREFVEYRGADTEMVSGAIGTDLVSTSQKRRFELYWVGLTETQVTHASTGVLKAWDAVRSSSASFTSPRGGSHTVTPRHRGAGCRGQLVFIGQRVAGGCADEVARGVRSCEGRGANAGRYRGGGRDCGDAGADGGDRMVGGIENGRRLVCARFA